MQDHNGPGEARPRTMRYESLDLWRGVACLLVLFCHSVYYVRFSHESPAQAVASGVALAAKWGWLGVPLFFIISGYCICASVDAARQRRSGVRDYFWRRFRRIYPPYWCYLVLAIGLIILTEDVLWPGLFTDGNHRFTDPRELSGWQWFGGLTLTETWRYHLVGDARLDFARHAWTLCYEEQFYAVCGLILLLAPRRLYQVVGALAGVILVLRHLSAWYGFEEPLSGFFFDGRWVVFAAGVLVYYQVSQNSWRVTLLTRLTLAAGVAYGLRSLSEIDAGTLCAFSFALLISLLHPLDRRLANLKILRPLMLCGTMCYSVYLIHYPIVKALSHVLSLAGVDGPVGTVLVTMPLCLAVSLVAATWFHRLVERRFLNAPKLTRQTREGDAAPVLQGQPLAA
jgi:peptidoglycan/LPS O-acetylase OafA/YrhL